MIRPRWRKILRDIWRNKRRTLLVVLSIAVGVFAVGTVAQMRVIVTDDMVESYEAANPPSAILYTAEPFDDVMVEAVRRMPQVAEAEARREVYVRFQHPQSDIWYPMRLFAAPDYENMHIGILRRELVHGVDPVRWPNPGVYPPPNRQIPKPGFSIKFSRAIPEPEFWNRRRWESAEKTSPSATPSSSIHKHRSVSSTKRSFLRGGKTGPTGCREMNSRSRFTIPGAPGWNWT